MIVVKISHVRKADLCMGGARAWFLKYGLSWRTFLAVGYPVETIEGTGDPFGLRVAAIARAEHSVG